MKLALHMGYWGSQPIDVMPLVEEAERLGFDSIWSAEAYGSDAVSWLAWVASRTSRLEFGTAIMQIPGRTPAATAMTAITLDHLSGGRFRLGVGMSGPQVVEGWHGSPYGKPLARTREYVEIIRAILRRDKPVVPRRVLHHPRGGGAGDHRPGEAPEDDRASPAAGPPHLPRCDRAEERGAGGRDRRRLDPHVLLAVTR